MSSSDPVENVANALTSEIRTLIGARHALDAMSDELKKQREIMKTTKARMLVIMTENKIDKANFDNYAVTVAKSTRKESINKTNRSDILKRVMEDTDAEEFAEKIDQCLKSESIAFIRLSKQR